MLWKLYKWLKKKLNWPVNSFAPFFIESQNKWKILMPEYVSFKATFRDFSLTFSYLMGNICTVFIKQEQTAVSVVDLAALSAQ